MEETPSELDWVNARADCELKTSFQKLRDAVEKDVELYNTKFELQPPQSAVFQKRDEIPSFSVYRKMPAGILSVEFRSTFDHIEIQDHCGVQELKVTPLLTPNGRCKFQVVGGEEVEQWQLRRKALEAIFFKQLTR
jgi:hypothetical protein